MTYSKPAARIIDAHTHIFPQKIAKKATVAIGAFYDLPMSHVGDPQALLDSGRKIGVDRYLVCSSATLPTQVHSINDFLSAQCAAHPEFFGFGTLHHAMESPEAELERIVSLGLHGVKLHPDFQRFYIDDPQAIRLYRLCAGAGLPILFHTGDSRYEYSAPMRLAHAMDRVPDLVCIAAHFGGYQRWEESFRYLKRDHVYFDTSSSLFALSREHALAMIEGFGADRFFFGTDHPMWDHESEIARFLSLGLPQETQDDILYRNFERVFGL